MAASCSPGSRSRTEPLPLARQHVTRRTDLADRLEQREAVGLVEANPRTGRVAIPRAPLLPRPAADPDDAVGRQAADELGVRRERGLAGALRVASERGRAAQHVVAVDPRERGEPPLLRGDPLARVVRRRRALHELAVAEELRGAFEERTAA